MQVFSINGFKSSNLLPQVRQNRQSNRPIMNQASRSEVSFTSIEDLGMRVLRASEDELISLVKMYRTVPKYGLDDALEVRNMYGFLKNKSTREASSRFYLALGRLEAEVKRLKSLGTKEADAKLAELDKDAALGLHEYNSMPPIGESSVYDDINHQY